MATPTVADNLNVPDVLSSLILASDFSNLPTPSITQILGSAQPTVASQVLPIPLSPSSPVFPFSPGVSPGLSTPTNSIVSHGVDLLPLAVGGSVGLLTLVLLLAFMYALTRHWQRELDKCAHRRILRDARKPLALDSMPGSRRNSVVVSLYSQCQDSPDAEDSQNEIDDIALHISGGKDSNNALGWSQRVSNARTAYVSLPSAADDLLEDRVLVPPHASRVVSSSSSMLAKPPPPTYGSWLLLSSMSRSHSRRHGRRAKDGGVRLAEHAFQPVPSMMPSITEEDRGRIDSGDRDGDRVEGEGCSDIRTLSTLPPSYRLY